MNTRVCKRAEMNGARAVATYLERVRKTGIGAGIDVARCLNPYRGAGYAKAWARGFDLLVVRHGRARQAGSLR